MDTFGFGLIWMHEQTNDGEHWKQNFKSKQKKQGIPFFSETLMIRKTNNIDEKWKIVGKMKSKGTF